MSGTAEKIEVGTAEKGGMSGIAEKGGSFPTHDLKFGQFCNSTKKFGRPKFCWIFSENFRFFLAILKKILFSAIVFHGKFC